jgi:Protein of unknown function (DUF3306)
MPTTIAVVSPDAKAQSRSRNVLAIIKNPGFLAVGSFTAIALLVAIALILLGPASAQDRAGSGRPADQAVAVGSIAPATASPAPSQPATAVDIDAPTKDSDFTIFMRPDVPEAVRTKALRKLWTTDAIYNQVAPHE